MTLFWNPLRYHLLGVNMTFKKWYTVKPLKGENLSFAFSSPLFRVHFVCCINVLKYGCNLLVTVVYNWLFAQSFCILEFETKCWWIFDLSNASWKDHTEQNKILAKVIFYGYILKVICYISVGPLYGLRTSSNTVLCNSQHLYVIQHKPAM